MAFSDTGDEELRLEFSQRSGLLRAAQGCSGLLRLGTVLYGPQLQAAYSPLKLQSHVCSDLEVEMELGEVKMGVRVYTGIVVDISQNSRYPSELMTIDA